MSIGLAKTQVANPANIGGAGGSSPFTDLFLHWCRVYVSDNNLSTGTWVNDGFLVNGINLTNQFSSTNYQAPGADIMLALVNTTNGLANQFSAVITNGTAAASGQGARWGNARVFTCRVFPKPNAGNPPLSDSVFFFGLSKDSGNGIKAGVGALSGVNATWFSTNAVVGFYFRLKDTVNWELLGSNGSGGFNLLDSGVSVDTTLSHELTFFYDGATTVTFYIDEKKVGQMTANLPANNLPMCMNAAYGNVSATVTGLTETFGFSYMALGMR